MSIQQIRPILISNICDPSLIIDSTSDASKIDEALGSLFDEALYYQYTKKPIKSALNSSLLNFLFFGEFPLFLHFIAKGITFSAELFDEIRSRLDRLTDEERQFVLEHFHEDIRPPFERNWQKPCTLKAVQAVAKIGSVISKQVGKAGRYCLSYTLPWMGAACKKLISPIISVPTQDRIIQRVEEVGKNVKKGLITYARKKLPRCLAKMIKHPAVYEMAECIFNTKLIKESMERIEINLNALPPRKIARLLFSSLEDLSRTHYEMSQMNQFDPTDDRSLLAELSLMASQNKLPLNRMNHGLNRLLSNGFGSELIAQECNSLFDEALEDNDVPFDEELFQEFCKEQNLEMVPRQCLTLVQKAFHIKNCNDHISPEVDYLADLVLMDPKRALTIPPNLDIASLIKHRYSPQAVEIGKKLLQEHFDNTAYFSPSIQDASALEMRFLAQAALKDNPSPEERRRLLSILSLADGALKPLFSPQCLMETIACHFVKEHLWPVILEKCFTDEGRNWLRILGKLTGQNIEDQLGNLLARSFIKNALSILTDSRSVSKLFLKLFNSPTEHLDDYRIIPGKDPFSPAEYRVEPSRYKTAALQYQSEDDLRGCFSQAASNMSFMKRLFLGSTVSDVGRDIVSLTKRADWGLWLLYLSNRIAEGLSNPSDISGLYLSDPYSRPGLKMIASDLFPAISWATSYESSFMHYLESGDKSLDEVNYSSIIQNSRISDLQKQVVLKIISLDSSKNESSALIRRQISQNLSEHVDLNVELIWGVAPSSPRANFLRERYLRLLMMAKPSELTSMLQHPRAFIQAKRSKLMQISTLHLQHSREEFLGMREKMDRLSDEIGRKTETITFFKQLEAEIDQISDALHLNPNDEVAQKRLCGLSGDIQSIPIESLRKDLIRLVSEKENLSRCMEACEYQISCIEFEQAILHDPPLQETSNN